MEKTPILEIVPGKTYVIDVKDNFHVTDKKRYGWNVVYEGKKYSLWVPYWENIELADFAGRQCAVVGRRDGKWIRLKFHEVYKEDPPTDTQTTPTEPPGADVESTVDLERRIERVDRLVEAYIDVAAAENELVARHTEDVAEIERIRAWFTPDVRQKIAVTWLIKDGK